MIPDISIYELKGFGASCLINMTFKQTLFVKMKPPKNVGSEQLISSVSKADVLLPSPPCLFGEIAFWFRCIQI
jgi:hypothetical protein